MTEKPKTTGAPAQQNVTFPSAGSTAHGYLALPPSGRGPAVIVIQASPARARCLTWRTTWLPARSPSPRKTSPTSPDLRRLTWQKAGRSSDVTLGPYAYGWQQTSPTWTAELITLIKGRCVLREGRGIFAGHRHDWENVVVWQRCGAEVPS
jgi:hypothetical protein